MVSVTHSHETSPSESHITSESSQQYFTWIFSNTATSALTSELLTTLSEGLNGELIQYQYAHYFEQHFKTQPLQLLHLSHRQQVKALPVSSTLSKCSVYKNEPFDFNYSSSLIWASDYCKGTFWWWVCFILMKFSIWVEVKALTVLYMNVFKYSHFSSYIWAISHTKWRLEWWVSTFQQHFKTQPLQILHLSHRQQVKALAVSLTSSCNVHKTNHLISTTAVLSSEPPTTVKESSDGECTSFLWNFQTVLYMNVFKYCHFSSYIWAISHIKRRLEWWVESVLVCTFEQNTATSDTTSESPTTGESSSSKFTLIKVQCAPKQSIQFQLQQFSHLSHLLQ